VSRLPREFAKVFWQLIAGGLCMATGVAAIFLGWFGAAHTRDVTDQIPYLISGGVFGLALCVIGSALYFSYFVAQVHHASRRQQRALEQMLMSAGARIPSADDDAGLVVTVPGGATYHRPGCPLAGGKDAAPKTLAEATEQGYKPCAICEPNPANVN